MGKGVLAALEKPDAGLGQLERELDALLLEYETLSEAWPREPHILRRAKIGRRVEDALAEIQRLQHAITKADAKSLSDAAVHLRRLAALLETRDSPLLRLQAPPEEEGRTMRHLLESALAAVETASERASH